MWDNSCFDIGKSQEWLEQNGSGNRVVEHGKSRSSLLRIEQLTPDKFQRYKQIRLAALADAPDAFGRTLAEEVAFSDEKWQDRLSDPDGVAFVAISEDDDVGLVGVIRHWDDAGDAVLTSMWVAPVVRRSGVGVALVRHAINWARRSGFAALRLEVADSNTCAVDFYKSLGFGPTGRKSTLPSPREHVTEHERILYLMGDE